MRALVTGCAGFIGSHLTESLLDDGYSVTGIDCFNDNYALPQKLRNLERATEWEGFDFIPIDLSRGALSEVVSACDVVFHLAAEPGVRASWGERFDTYLRNNVQATQHLLEAARAEPTKPFVFASSSSVYGQAERFPTAEDVTPRPHSPYGTTKLAAEHLCLLYHRNYGINSVALRYFSVYGPRQRPDMAFEIFLRSALRDEPVQIFGDGKQTRDFTYVADVVAATRAAAQRHEAVGNVYNIGGGSRVSLLDCLASIETVTGRSVQIEHAGNQLGDVRDTAADTSRAAEELDFVPGTDLNTGLTNQFKWVSSNEVALRNDRLSTVFQAPGS